MSEDLQLRGMSERTPEMSVRAVRPLAQPFPNSPAQLPAEDLRPYCLSLKNVKQSSRRATTMARCGSKCFVEPTLKNTWTTLAFVRPAREQTLPVSLSREEGRESFSPVRLCRSRAGLTTISSCGLRLQEGPHLRVPAIDRARRLRHLRQGQGGKDRDVPLPHRPRELRRQDWATQRQPGLSFPASGRGRIPAPTPPAPRPKRRVQGACRAALKESRVNNLACGHTLRHAWATPLLEAGVNLRLSQA